jgi:hypothetical protein
MRLGATLISPASIGWDLYLGYSPGWKCYFGSIMTLIGFLFINLTWDFEDKQKYVCMTQGKCTPNCLKVTNDDDINADTCNVNHDEAGDNSESVLNNERSLSSTVPSL